MVDVLTWSPSHEELKHQTSPLIPFDVPKQSDSFPLSKTCLVRQSPNVGWLTVVKTSAMCGRCSASVLLRVHLVTLRIFWKGCSYKKLCTLELAEQLGNDKSKDHDVLWWKASQPRHHLQFGNCHNLDLGVTSEGLL